MTQYLYKGIVYSIVPCEEKDIPSHIERVYLYWKQDKELNLDRRYNDLHLCISLNRAYKLISKDKEYAVVYYNKFCKYTQILLFWAKIKPFIAMMLDWGESIHKNDLLFMPHRQNFIQYEFLISEENKKVVPLVIDVTSEEYINFMNKQKKKFKRL